MNRRILLSCSLAALIAASACGGADDPTVGDGVVAARLPSSPTALPAFDPAQFRALLRRLQGRPVVVNIWASWCGPCVAEAPDLAQAAREYKGRVQFLGVDIQDHLAPARAFVRRFGWSYPSVFDATGAIRDDLGLIGQPNTVVYDPTGAKAFVASGPVTLDALRPELDRLVASAS